MAERKRAADDFDIIRDRLGEIGRRPWHDESAAPTATAASSAAATPKYSSRSAFDKQGKSVWCTAVESDTNAPRCHRTGGECCKQVYDDYC